MITAVDGTPTPTMDDVNEIKENKQAGDKITLTVYRISTGKTLNITVTLMDAHDLEGDDPAPRAARAPRMTAAAAATTRARSRSSAGNKKTKSLQSAGFLFCTGRGYSRLPLNFCAAAGQPSAMMQAAALTASSHALSMAFCSSAVNLLSTHAARS